MRDVPLENFPMQLLVTWTGETLYCVAVCLQDCFVRGHPASMSLLRIVRAAARASQRLDKRVTGHVAQRRLWTTRTRVPHAATLAAHTHRAPLAPLKWGLAGVRHRLPALRGSTAAAGHLHGTGGPRRGLCTAHADACDGGRDVVGKEQQTAAQTFNAGVHHLQEGRPFTAVAMFRRLLQPGSPVMPPAADDSAGSDSARRHESAVRVNIGVALQVMGCVAQAREEFVRAVALTPRDPHVHAALGSLDQLQGNTRSAATHYAQALLLDPHYARAQVGLCMLGVREVFDELLAGKPLWRHHDDGEAGVLTVDDPKMQLVQRVLDGYVDGCVR